MGKREQMMNVTGKCVNNRRGRMISSCEEKEDILVLT